jgi:hypothetical protein
MIFLPFPQKRNPLLLTAPPSSHLTSRTPTQSNLYLAISLATVVSEPDLYRLYTFHAPNLMFLFHCLGHTKGSVQAQGTCILFHNKARFYGEELLAPCPTPKLEDHTLSTVCGSLFNIFTATLHIGGHSSICNLRMHQAR